jgi:hypothetical protein
VLEFYFLDLPIYRCEEEWHDAEAERAATKSQDWLAASGAPPPEQAPHSYEDIAVHTRSAFGSWTFNQVVGWLRLYARPSHIGAHLWWVDAKQVRRKMRHKRFRLTSPSNVLPTYFTPKDDSQMIYRTLLEHLEQLADESPIKGRHLELTVLRNLGPLINWKKLLNHSEERYNAAASADQKAPFSGR